MDDCRQRRGKESRPAGPSKLASQSIKIIHEDIDNDPEFQTAKELLSEAEIIGFLGFGYDVTNLQRLDIRGKFLGEVYRQKKRLYGTVLGLGLAEQAWVRDYIRGRIVLQSSKIVKFLKDQPVIIHPPDLYEPSIDGPFPDKTANNSP